MKGANGIGTSRCTIPGFTTRRGLPGRYEEWLVNEVNHLRTVVAKLTAENLTLKRGLLV